jgi:hypothetical protein
MRLGEALKLNLSLGGVTSLQILASFAFQFVIIHIIGVGADTDAWVAAQSFPIFLFSIMTVSIQGVWQHKLSLPSNEKPEWLRIFRIALGQVWMVSVPLAIFLFLLTYPWIEFIFRDFSIYQVGLVKSLLPLLYITAIINSQIFLSTIAMRGRNKFITCELISLGGAFFSIALVWISLGYFGIEVAAWILFIRSLVVLIALNFLLGFPTPLFRIAYHDLESWRSIKPLLKGNLLSKSGPIFDRVFSSLSPIGGMTVFNFFQLGFWYY